MLRGKKKDSDLGVRITEVRKRMRISQATGKERWAIEFGNQRGQFLENLVINWWHLKATEACFLWGGAAVKISDLPLQNKEEKKQDLGKVGAERNKGSKLYQDQTLLILSNTEERGRKWEN